MYPKSVTSAGLNKLFWIKRSVEVAKGKTVQSEILQENLKSQFHPWAVAQRAAAPKQRAAGERNNCQKQSDCN